MIEYKIVNHEEKYMQGAADLFNVVYKPKVSITAEHFINKHFNNPANAAGMTVCIAIDEDRVVGSAFFMSGEHRYKNQTYKTALASDYMTHPDYQRRGICTKLTEMGEDYLKDAGYDFLTTFPSSNAASKPVFLRSGWQEVFTYDYYILPCVRPRFLFDRIFGSKVSQFAKSMEKTEVKVGLQDVFDNDDFLALNSDESRIYQTRSKVLYDFKFNNKGTTHHYLKLTEDTKTELLLVVKEDLRRFKGVALKFLDIVDYKYCGDIGKEVFYFATAIKALRKLGSAIVIWESTDDLFNGKVLKKLGFKGLSKLNVGRMKHHLMVKILKPSTPTEIMLRENWNLQWLETDI